MTSKSYEITGIIRGDRMVVYIANNCLATQELKELFNGNKPVSCYVKNLIIIGVINLYYENEPRLNPIEFRRIRNDVMAEITRRK